MKKVLGRLISNASFSLIRLVSTYDLAMTSNSALGVLENHRSAKYWTKAIGSDCFYTVETVYEKATRRFEEPKNTYGINNPIQLDGLSEYEAN